MSSHEGNFDSASAVELAMLRRLNQDFMKALESDLAENNNDTVNLQMNPDGVTINVFDRARKPVFEPQSTRFTTYGEWIFSTLAWEIARSSNFTVELEGHTESGNTVVSNDYGDWEISADRATAVRRKLLESGVPARQVIKVAGYGDTVPMPEHDSADEINRRVTVLLNLRPGGKKA
jgi:chemotaxis protein MotB